MKGLIVIVVAAAGLLLAAPSSGAAPTGFWANKRLTPAASFVSGKPVVVYCANTQAALEALAASADTVPDLQGLATVGGDAIYLSPLTCAYLDAWLNGRNVKNQYGVAGSMLTLAHEAEHTHGVSDETDTDCAALYAMPQMVVKFFPLLKRESLHDLMFDAWRGHSTKPPQYQTHPC